MRKDYDTAADRLPTHAEFIANCCGAAGSRPPVELAV